ncbi:hypothetical protein [uncultured Aquimarina sp.]|uniref:hypothetical protein n=1 Tax=uncultured Aquimarina sp. TaxID=575652 RepID=UPI0026272CF2|nr:hypothetical protein [uncultured Aquimarina sp.]
MKTQTDKTQEPQKETIQRVELEPSTEGMAVIEDNRTITVVQRKLRSAMGDSEKPIQQKRAKGSSKFKEIAASMGQQYGVDTSSLKATHNSSFPAKLNAEATIQGSQIHFAPGMDTDFHIKHEVAHAIDNTISGIPKGNKIVNGQNIDTTREDVVDKMARNSLNSSLNQSLSVQRKISINSLNTDKTTMPIQRTMRHANMIRQMVDGRSVNGFINQTLPNYNNIRDIIIDRQNGNISAPVLSLMLRAINLDNKGKGPAFDTTGANLPVYDQNNTSIVNGNLLLQNLNQNVAYQDHYNFLTRIVNIVNNEFGGSGLIEFWNGGHIIFEDGGQLYHDLIVLGRPLAILDNLGNILPKNEIAGRLSSHWNNPIAAIRDRQISDPNSANRTAGAFMKRRPQNSETSHYGNRNNYANQVIPPQYGLDMPVNICHGHVLFGLTYQGHTFVQTEGAGFQDFNRGIVEHLKGFGKNKLATTTLLSNNFKQRLGVAGIKPQTGMFGTSNLSEKETPARILSKEYNDQRQDRFDKMVNELIGNFY